MNVVCFKCQKPVPGRKCETCYSDKCCPDDFGGSHYHCSKCGCVSGMMGHLAVDCPPVEERPPYAVYFAECDDCGMVGSHTADCFYHGPY